MAQNTSNKRRAVTIHPPARLAVVGETKKTKTGRKEERHPKQWQTGYSPRPPTSSNQNQTLHGCVIIHVKCDPNRSRGYGTVGVENGPFLLLWPVAYTTACTTVQAVITATSVSYGKMETLTSCKIETLEQIDTQFVRIDYVHERNVFFQIW